MPKIIQPQDITLADLKERFSLQKSTDESFLMNVWNIYQN